MPVRPEIRGAMPGKLTSKMHIITRCMRAAPAPASAAAVPPPSSEHPPSPSPPPLLSERGVRFMQGPAFYRPESAQGRDLAVLAAAVHRRRTGRLRVLDVMSGSGVRGARYLQQVRGRGCLQQVRRSGVRAARYLQQVRRSGVWAAQQVRTSGVRGERYLQQARGTLYRCLNQVCVLQISTNKPSGLWSLLISSQSHGPN